MSYFTGTVTTSADLKTLIEAKAVLEGWSLAGGWLSKGLSNVQLTTPNDFAVKMLAANSSDGATESSVEYQAIRVPSAAWPVTYYLFLNTSPDTIVCVVKYSTTLVQVLMFGELVKIHSSAYVGGNFYFASSNMETTDDFTYSYAYINNTRLVSGSATFGVAGSAVIPFTWTEDASFTSSTRPEIHIKIDNNVWTTPVKVSYTDTTISSLYRSPNLYNSQTHLVPMNLQFAMTDSLYGYLGYVEHVRLCRVDNYEIGDIIDISPDQWMVFPWHKKDMLNRNGTGAINTFGSVGFAVRYTP